MSWVEPLEGVLLVDRRLRKRRASEGESACIDCARRDYRDYAVSCTADLGELHKIDKIVRCEP